MTKYNWLIKLLGITWCLGFISLVFTISIQQIVPKHFLPTDIEKFQFIDFIIQFIFFIIGIGLLMKRRWAWICALVVVLSFLVHSIWIAIEFHQVLLADIVFVLFQFALLPLVKRDLWRTTHE